MYTGYHMITCDDVIVAVTAVVDDLVLQSAINDNGGLMFFLCGVVFNVFLSTECPSCKDSTNTTINFQPHPPCVAAHHPG